MNPYRRALFGTLGSLLASCAMVLPAVAQSLTPAPSPAAGGSDGPGLAIVAVAILGLLVAIGIGVKLHDVKQRREEEAAALQAQISDALMTDRSLADLALTPSVQAPFRRSGLLAVTLSGLVPTPELREAAIQLVMRKMEQARVSFRIEDRIVVDPMVARHAA